MLPVAASAGHGQLSGIDEEQQITPSLEATAPGSVVLAREQGASSSSSSSTRRPPLDQKRRCMSDRFMMYTYKIKLCKREDPHNWRLCPYAHPGEAGRRRPPHVYRAAMCNFGKTKKECAHGESCLLAKNALEYWLHPDKYRTSLCGHGEACTRNICFFAHNDQELRIPDLLPAESSPAQAAAAPPMYAVGAGLCQAMDEMQHLSIRGQEAHPSHPPSGQPGAAHAPPLYMSLGPLPPPHGQGGAAPLVLPPPGGAALSAGAARQLVDGPVMATNLPGPQQLYAPKEQRWQQQQQQRRHYVPQVGLQMSRDDVMQQHQHQQHQQQYHPSQFAVQDRFPLVQASHVHHPPMHSAAAWAAHQAQTWAVSGAGSVQDPPGAATSVRASYSSPAGSAARQPGVVQPPSAVQALAGQPVQQQQPQQQQPPQVAAGTPYVAVPLASIYPPYVMVPGPAGLMPSSTPVLVPQQHQGSYQSYGFQPLPSQWMVLPAQGTGDAPATADRGGVGSGGWPQQHHMQTAPAAEARGSVQDPTWQLPSS